MKKIRMDMLIENVMTEWFTANHAYLSTSKDYYRRHGYGVNFSKKDKSREEKSIEHYYHAENSAQNAVWAVTNVLGMDRDAIDRLYLATRAVNKWYERTQWQKNLPEEVYSRLEDYVFGAKPKKEWWERW